LKDFDISTIAKETGVSIATVSRVLNNEHGVSDEVRRKTLDFMDQKGYRPRPNIKRSTRLGVVMQDEAPAFYGFFAHVLTGIFAYASEENVETALLHYVPSRNAAMSMTEFLRRKRCNGALTLASVPVNEEQLVASRIPIVCIANRGTHPQTGYIDCDSYAGASEQMQYLLRLGHVNIGFLSGKLEGFVDHQERLAAYRDALAAAGIQARHGWVSGFEPGPTEQAGYLQARRLLSAHPEITAIFACNDSMAYGAVCACVEAGRRVPEDISVVGYDDDLTSRFYNPPLTTVRQPLREMGYEAAKWVDRKLKGKLEELPRKVLSPELIVRRSCAPPPASALELSTKKLSNSG
jgi:DNA-binding LacI/PurR family transcriptional regulator